MELETQLAEVKKELRERKEEVRLMVEEMERMGKDLARRRYPLVDVVCEEGFFFGAGITQELIRILELLQGMKKFNFRRRNCRNSLRLLRTSSRR